MENTEFLTSIRHSFHDKFLAAGQKPPMKVGMSRTNYEHIREQAKPMLKEKTDVDLFTVIGTEIYAHPDLTDDYFVLHFLDQTLLINAVSGKAINMPMMHAAFTLNPRYYEN